MTKHMLKPLIIICILFSAATANAVDGLLATSPDFTNLSGVGKCPFEEHKPGSAYRKIDLEYFYIISLPKTWGAVGIQCDPLSVGKNIVPKVRVNFSRSLMGTPPAIPYLEHQRASSCQLQTGAQKTVITAINCHTLMSPNETLEQKYNAAYKKVTDQNCWSNYFTRHVSSAPGCAAVKKEFETAFDRYKEDNNMNGARYSCTPTADSFDKIKNDKKISCKFIEQTCTSYDPEHFKDFCKTVQNQPSTPVVCPAGTTKQKNNFDEEICACQQDDFEMKYFVGGQCVAASVDTCRKYDDKQRYVFQQGQCLPCRTGLAMDDGVTCGCHQGYKPEAGACVPASGQQPPAQAACSGQNNTPTGTQIKQGNSCYDCASIGKINNPERSACIAPGGQTTAPDSSCRSGIRKANGQCCMSVNFASNTCNDSDAQTPPADRRPGAACTNGTDTGTYNDKGECVKNVACFSSSSCGEGRRCENGQCQSICQNGQVFQNGQCMNQQQECPQGQIRQNGQCVPQQQQCKQDEEMIQGRCFPKKPNAQQPKEQPKQQQQGPTPQQQQQMQQLQAMQECQMRQPQGAWQWNGFQCLPNPNYKPQGYGTQPSVTAGVVCNFFGSDAIEVPAGEQFSVTYDVSGAKREIKVDTSPKSTTKYERQTPTTQPANTSVLNQFGYNQDGTPAGANQTVQTSQQGQATITAPKKKGKLKVSLIIDAVRQNSEACKPITVTITDAVPQQSSYDSSGSTSNYDSGSSYASQDVGQQDAGPTIETPSEIIAQNRRTITSQPAQKAPEDDDAYAYLCKTLGIGCAKDVPETDSAPSIRDLQLRNDPAQGSTREITIDPNSEDPADLPNIGELPGENGGQVQQQQLATDIGVDGDNKKAYSTVLNYLGENGQYAEPIGPNNDTSGVLNSTDSEPSGQTEDRIGIFTRMWRWFLNLLGFGPEYVAA